jgi:hypothetical protein
MGVLFFCFEDVGAIIQTTPWTKVALTAKINPSGARDSFQA